MRVEPWWLVLCRSCVLLEPRRARASSEHAATARLAMGCIWLLADFMKVVKPEREPQPPIRIYNNTLSHKRGIMQSVQVLCERDATPTYGKPKLTPNTPRFDPPRAGVQPSGQAHPRHARDREARVGDGGRARGKSRPPQERPLSAYRSAPIAQSSQHTGTTTS